MHPPWSEPASREGTRAISRYDSRTFRTSFISAADRTRLSPASTSKMGNAAGTLGVVINEASATAGGALSGVVYVMVNSEINAEYLMVTVGGEEYALVAWRQTTGSGDNRKTVTKRRRYRRALLHMDAGLADFSATGGKLAPGRYEFPFTLRLPVGLPSSMSSHGPHGSKCRITYSISARLGRPGFFTSDFRTARQVLVSSAPLPPLPNPVFVEPDTQQVNFCCCFNRGSMTLGASLDDTAVERGGTVGVGLACKNDSTSEILGVDIEVTEHVRWGPVNGGGRHNDRSRVIARISVDPSQVMGTQALSAEQRQASSGMSAHHANYSTLFHQLSTASGTRAILNLPPDARDSYVGSAIKTWTTMSLTLRTGSCITNPALSLSLRVGSPRPYTPLTQAVAFPAVGAQPIPIVVAVPIVLETPLEPLEDEKNSIASKPADWSGAIVAPIVEVPMATAVLGGSDVTEGDDDEGAAAATLVTGGVVQEIISVQGLKAEMDRSLDDYTMLNQKIQGTDTATSSAWRAALAAISPPEFGELVGRVNLEFDQPKFATTLASVLTGGVTVQHVVCAVRATHPMYKASMVQALVPLCASNGIQLDANAGALIRQQLSPWDQVVCGDVLPPPLQGP